MGIDHDQCPHRLGQSRCLASETRRWPCSARSLVVKPTARSSADGHRAYWRWVSWLWLDDKLDVASRSFYEATFPAAQFSQAGRAGRSIFARSANAHVMMGGQNVYPPLEPAAAWTRTRRMQRAQAAILLAGISRNAALQLGQTRQAMAMLSQSKRAMGRSELPRSDLGARWQFHSALLGHSKMVKPRTAAGRR